MSGYRTELFIDGAWRDQGLVFVTEFEAREYGRTFIHAVYRACATDEQPNYRYQSGKLVPGAGPISEQLYRKLWQFAFGSHGAP